MIHITEQKFPIYRFTATWNQENYQNDGSCHDMMFRNEQTPEELTAYIENWKQNISNKKTEEGHPITEWLDVSYEFVEFETWMLRWFCHMTYNQFENDYEASGSFEEFVRRKETLNESNGHYGNFKSDNSNPYYCLMGAEDRWRWEVCHCDGCKKNDWIIINH